MEIPKPEVIAMAVIALLECVGLPLIISFLGGLTFPCWYNDPKAFTIPVWTPPNWLFPIAWSIWYVLMGISSFLLLFFSYRRGRNDDAYQRRVIMAFLAYVANLILVGIWPAIFNSFGDLVGTLVEILFLEAVIIAMLVTMWQVHPIPAVMNLPYFLWITYAVSMSIGVVILNPNGVPECECRLNFNGTA